MLQLPRPRGHDIAVLFSEATRAANVRAALQRAQTYTFTDERGGSRTWLKGEHAYLAPNAADLLLSRCNLKHDVVPKGWCTCVGV